MSWTEISKKETDMFPEAPNFDYKRFHKFVKKYGYTHYSGPPTVTDMETFMLTKTDEKWKKERGLPPHYSNAVFLSGQRRPTLLVYQPFMHMEDVLDDLSGWNVGNNYEVHVYDEGQTWYDTEAKNICSITVTLAMINFRDALKIIGKIIGINGKPPKEQFTEDEIREMIRPFRRIEGMKPAQSKTISDLLAQIERQLETEQVSMTPFKKMREIIDDPKSYDRNI